MTSDRATSGPSHGDDEAAARHGRLQSIFDECRQLSGADRARELDARCGGDLELRRGVEELLEALEDEAGLFSEAELERGRRELERVAEEQHPAEGGHEWLPERIGGYRILSRLGAGGMGVVYEAEQTDPRRRVALKLIHPGQSSVERNRRFRREAHILGRLQHPGIAQVYELGSFDLGRGAQPFIAMELVDGVDLLHYAEREGLDLRERLKLVAMIADALHSAHRAGVVHRDLKPDNVLVDGDGRPRILDFGIAFTADDSTLLSTMVTEEGKILGTLSYMAPEQLGGKREAITPRADVYSLGVLAFELLCGELPLDPAGMPITAGMRMLASEEPTRLGSVQPRLRGDVDTIVGRALDKEPARRYESAEALASDLRRFLGDRPIAARPPSRLYRLRKFASRHRGLVATLVVLLVGVVTSTILALFAQRQTRVSQSLERKIADDLYFAELQLAADLAEEAGGAARMQELLAHWVPAEGAEDRRGWEWYLLEALSRPRETVLESEGWVLTTEWHPSRDLVVTGEVPARVYDVERGEFIAELPTTQFSEDAAWSPSGDVVVLCAPSETRAYSTDSWEELVAWTSPVYGSGLSWHPDGSHFLVTTVDGDVFRFDRGDWQARLVHESDVLFGGPGMIEHHPNGKELATLALNRNIAQVHDLDSWQVLRELQPPDPSVSLTCLAWAPDGERLAVGSAGGHIQLWRRSDWELLRTTKHHGQFMTHLEWNPDGRRLASSSRDTSIQVTDVDTGQLLRMHRGHSLITEYVDWDPRGERLVSGSKDATMRLWPGEDRGAVWTQWVPGGGVVHSPVCSWSPDGSHLATDLGDDVRLWRWDGRRLHELEGRLHGVRAFWDRSGERVATHGDSSVHIHGWRDGSHSEVDLGEDFTYWVHMSWHPRDGTLTVGNGGSVWEIDPVSDPPARLIVDEEFDQRSLEWSPDGERLLIVNPYGLRLLDRETGELRLGPRFVDVQLITGTWSPDGSRVVAALDDLTLRVWEVEGWREVQQLRGHNNQLQWCAWSPDGSRLASGDQDGRVHLWDAETGRLTATLDAGGGAAHHLQWSPSGEQLAVVTHERRIRIWNAAARRDLE